jgi:IS5 family transposase
MQRPADRQPTFFDLAMSARGGGNRLLETIHELIDFQPVEELLAQTYSRLGRPAHRPGVMLRIMVLQHLYGLSDPQAEEQLRDRLSFQKFVGLHAEEVVPDETAICRFRERLLACQLEERLLELVNSQLAAQGYLVKRTVLVDATLVESSRKRPAREVASSGQAPDAEARYTRKNGRSYYGYKAHLSADGQHQLIDRVRATSAEVHDGAVFPELVDPEAARAAYADKAYDSKNNRAWLKAHGIANGILKKGAHHIKLTPADSARNARKSRRRCHIERIFAHLKRWHHYTRARYVGLAKNQLELVLKAVAYNLKRMSTLVGAQ